MCPPERPRSSCRPWGAQDSPFPGITSNMPPSLMPKGPGWLQGKTLLSFKLTLTSLISWVKSVM